jgi:hypothetical protein
VLDGVYRRDTDGAPSFIGTNAPTDDELHALLQRPRSRLRLHLIRYHGVLAPNATLRARVVPHGLAARGPASGAAGEIQGEAQPGLRQARARDRSQERNPRRLAARPRSHPDAFEWAPSH